MTAGDIFFLIVHWLHVVAAAAWVGGSLFYLLALRPAARRQPEAAGLVRSAVGTEFRILVDASIIVLVVTGAVIAFNRLTNEAATPAYGITLGLKVALSLWTFMQVWAERRKLGSIAPYRGPERAAPTGWRRLGEVFSGYNGVIVVGIVVFLLSDLMKFLYEKALV
ncbi:MAG: hypothetical protein FJ312_02425 [SAR202 cluster bacterium]|nr:hypothetical protein [SAR202 cluster bacterium]